MIEKKWDRLFWGLFFVTFIFLLYKLRYGYFYNDEPFLFGLGYRLAKGDLIFTHDWSVQILTAYLVFPFAKIYTLFNPHTEGIILFGRYCYLILWSLTVIFMYYNFRKFKLFGILGCISILLFAPLDMMTLSYNSFCLIGLLWSSTIMFNAKKEYMYLFAGFAFSIAVLAIPYMLLIYVLFSLYCFLSLFSSKLKMFNDLSVKKAWVYFTLGAGIHVIIFALFVFYKNDLNGIITGISNILSGNTEHKLLGPIELFMFYLDEFNQRFLWYGLFSLIAIIITVFDKNRVEHKKYYYGSFLIAVLIQSFYLITVKNTYPNLNLVMIPITLFGIEVFVLNKNIKPFMSFIVLGLVCSVIFLQSSNLGLPALGMAYVISMFGTMLLLQNEIKTNYYLALSIVIVFLCTQFIIRFDNYYLDDNIGELTCKLEYGPGKGIYTNVNDCEKYAYLYEQINWLVEDINEEDGLLILDNNPWLYYISKSRYSSYSTWGSWNDIYTTLEMNKKYYDKNSDKAPNNIIVEKSYIPDFENYIDDYHFEGYLTKEAWDYVLFYKE